VGGAVFEPLGKTFLPKGDHYLNQQQLGVVQICGLLLNVLVPFRYVGGPPSFAPIYFTLPNPKVAATGVTLMN